MNLRGSADAHVARRDTRLGRWLPAAFYATNYLLWVITCVVAGANEFLPLAVFPVPALVLYVVRTRRATR